ncbi:MAG: endonuclease/exonuclease/phosphatase family protein [Proteobacteria bacterium]|jgi:endonuclease/exonuclease/phosphatase family metal-dependent hydrolase|nr:endonuclease/exonuclease/phosphatase family protein [Pseudomonadota bacterium]
MTTPHTLHDTDAPAVLRVATYNIHKGVQGLGPGRRLEIHNLALAVETLDADIVCLQEVRAVYRRGKRHFTAWPEQPQAEFLAPEGYDSAYCTNAVTRHGEHGNALLSRWPILGQRHEDMSDHRFEQRGLLHVEVQVASTRLHVIVVHFGLIPSSRLRQTQQLSRYIAREIPLGEPVVVAGDFNDWGTRVRRLLHVDALQAFEGPRTLTYPSRFPVAQLDHIYARGLRPLSLAAPSGRVWSRMSDHLPLIAEFRMTP